MAGAFMSYFFADAYSKSGFLDRSPVLALLIITGVAIVSSVGTAVLLRAIRGPALAGTLPASCRSSPRSGLALHPERVPRVLRPPAYGYPQPNVLEGTIWILGVDVKRVYALVFVVAVVSMLALQAFVSRTRTGRSMRAVAEDREIASLDGHQRRPDDQRRVAIGGALAGITGVLFCLSFQQVVFTMGFLSGDRCVHRGGAGRHGEHRRCGHRGLHPGSPPGRRAPAVLLRVRIPSPNSLRDAFVFLVLVIVLIFRPRRSARHG